MSSLAASAETTPRPRPKHGADLRALGGYLLLAAFFYAPILLGLRTFPNGDFNGHFLPFSLFQRSELLAGRLAIWNPYTYAGHPFLADVQAAVFYPLSNLVLGLTLPWAGAGARLYWLEVEAALHVAFAGFFTYLLAKTLTGRGWAAFLAGCAFAFSGYLTGYPPLQLAVLRTAVWLPLILWLLWRAFETPGRWRWWVGAALAYAVAFLAGHSQTFFFLSYAVAGWIALLAWVQRRALRCGPLALRVVAFYGIALGLSAAQLLPSLEFTRLSVRAAADYAFLSGGFPLQDTWQMLLPHVLTQFSPLYVGIVGLGLALIGIAAAGFAPQTVRFRAGAFFFAAMAALALLVSYGGNAFLYPLLHRFAPGWTLFRGQERAAYLVAFGLSMLAGYGAAAFFDLPTARRRRWTAVYALAAAAGVAALGLLRQRAGRTAVTPGEFLLLAATAMVLLLGLAAIAWVKTPGKRARLALIALVVADLFIANYATNLDAGTPGQKAALPPEAVAAAQAVHAAGGANLGLPGRTYNEYRAPDDWGMLADMEDIWGSSPLRLGRYATLFDGFPLDRLWRLTGITHTLTWRRDLPVAAELLAEFPQKSDSTYLHRLAELNPRAWVVDQVRFAPDIEAKRLLADGGFDLDRISVVAPPSDPQGGGAALPGEGRLAAPGSHTVRLARSRPGRLAIDVESQHGGLLVVSENWMPGWRATARSRENGADQEAPVVRANLSFLGIPVGPGATHVELTYRPTSVYAGLTIAAATALLLALAWLWRRSPAQRRASYLSRDALWALALLGVLLSAFALRVYRLGYQELRGDEAFGYFFTQASIGTIIRNTIALREPHPIGSYLLQKGVWALLGQGEFALRFASAWFGALAAALLYRLARGLGFNRAAATLGAALLAFSPYAIWHSQDARMYAMSMALTLGSTVLLVEGLRRNQTATWAGYVAVSWLALHVHYFAVFVLAAQVLYVAILALLERDMRRRALAWLVAMIVLGVCYLPWLLAARDTLAGYRGNGDSPGPAAMTSRALSVFAVGETIPADQRILWAGLAGVLLILAGWRLAKESRPARRALLLLALYLAVPVLATWVSALNRPIFNERYLIAAAPPFYLLLAAAVFGHGAENAAESGRRRASLAAAVLLGLLVLGIVGSAMRYYGDPEYSKTRGWRELARAMEAQATGADPERTRLAQTYPDPVLWYYTGPVAHLVLPPAAHDEAGARREVTALVEAGVERITLAVQPSEAWDDRDIGPAALAEHYVQVSSKPVSDWDVQTYVRAPAGMAPSGAEWTNGVTLAAAALAGPRLAPGGPLVAFLDWAGDAAQLTGSEKLTVQLLDANGALVAQADAPFGAGDLAGEAQPYVLEVPWALPAGNYTVIAALYDPGQEGAPRVSTVAGSDHVTLGALAAP
jgi:hypothetical protein